MRTQQKKPETDRESGSRDGVLELANILANRVYERMGTREAAY